MNTQKTVTLHFTLQYTPKPPHKHPQFEIHIFIQPCNHQLSNRHCFSNHCKRKSLHHHFLLHRNKVAGDAWSSSANKKWKMDRIFNLIISINSTENFAFLLTSNLQSFFIFYKVTFVVTLSHCYNFSIYPENLKLKWRKLHSNKNSFPRFLPPAFSASLFNFALLFIPHNAYLHSPDADLQTGKAFP